MSEKRIKLVTQQVWESGSAVHLPDVPVGTPVEIVYRDDVEIRPGQKWRVTADEVVLVCKVGKRWCAMYMHGRPMHESFGELFWEKTELQSWLNEHAELVPEGES